MKSTKSAGGPGVTSSLRSQGVVQPRRQATSLEQHLTLQNSRHLSLLSKIHHLAMTNAEHHSALLRIKKLIDGSGLLDFDGVGQSSRPSLPHQLSVSPLLSLASSNQDVSISDTDLTGRNINNHILSIQTERNPSIRQNIIHNIGNNSDSETDPSTPKSIKQINNVPLDIGDMSASKVGFATAPPVQKPEPALTLLPTPAPASASANGYDEADGTDGDGDDEEFTLEEELAGIADAPVEERASMRKALRETQSLLNRQMRESAADKRRIAEKEAYLIKQTLLRNGAVMTPSSDPSASKPFQSSNFEVAQPTTPKAKHGHGYQNSAPSTKHSNTPPKSSNLAPTAPAVATATTKTTVESVQDTDTDSLPAAKLMPVDNSDDDDDKSQSSGIISFDVDTPKNSNRFGITFDPSKLDDATRDRISGIVGNKDTRRSVLVQNIPSETTVHEILAYIRGGSVLAVTLASNPADGGKTQTVMVTFKTSKEAHASLDLSASFLSRPGPASKWCFGLLATASYPSNDVIPSFAPGYSGLSLSDAPTRCLRVDNFPRYLINELCTELYLNKSHVYNKVHVLEEMWFAGDTLHIHFTSIQEAKKAYDIISVLHYGKYRTNVHYSPDPCAGTKYSLSSQGTAKLASGEHQGLKSLLETTGLVGYAKLFSNRTKSAVAAAAPRSTPRSVPMSIFSAAPAAAPGYRPVARTAVQLAAQTTGASSPVHTMSSQSQVFKPAVANFSNSTASLLMSIDPGMRGVSAQAKVGAVHSDIQLLDVGAESVPATGSSPWTDTLMAGLDLF